MSKIKPVGYLDADALLDLRSERSAVEHLWAHRASPADVPVFAAGQIWQAVEKVRSKVGPMSDYSQEDGERDYWLGATHALDAILARLGLEE